MLYETMKLSIYAVGDKKEAYEDGIARRRAEVRIQLIKERRLYVDTAMLQLLETLLNFSSIVSSVGIFSDTRKKLDEINLSSLS